MNTQIFSYLTVLIALLGPSNLWGTAETFTNASRVPQIDATAQEQDNRTAKNLITQWQINAKTYVNGQTDMDAAYKILSQAKYTLKQLIRTNALQKDISQEARTTIYMLRLLQLQTIIKAVALHKSAFQDSLRAFANNEPANPPKTFSKEWFFIRKNRAAQLLHYFQELLNQHPAFVTNPPLWLLGQDFPKTFKEGYEVYLILNRQYGCFQNPEQGACLLMQDLVMTGQEDEQGHNANNSHNSTVGKGVS